MKVWRVEGRGESGRFGLRVVGGREKVRGRGEGEGERRASGSFCTVIAQIGIP